MRGSLAAPALLALQYIRCDRGRHPEERHCKQTPGNRENQHVLQECISLLLLLQLEIFYMESE